MRHRYSSISDIPGLRAYGPMYNEDNTAFWNTNVRGNRGDHKEDGPTNGYHLWGLYCPLSYYSLVYKLNRRRMQCYVQGH
jgi:hypothetical protein